MKELEKKFGITDKETIKRLNTLKKELTEKYSKDFSYGEIIDLLESTINWDEMQIWILENKAKGKRTTLSDELKKHFESITDEEIISLYDEEKNKQVRKRTNKKKTTN